MVTKCCVKNCKTNSLNLNGCQLHKFPTSHAVQLAAWIKATGLRGAPKSSTKICSAHFLVSDYQIRPGAKKMLLMKNAVPSVFTDLVGNSSNNLFYHNASAMQQCPQNHLINKNKVFTAGNIIDKESLHTLVTTCKEVSGSFNQGDPIASVPINDVNLDDSNFEFITNYILLNESSEEQQLKTKMMQNQTALVSMQGYSGLKKSDMSMSKCNTKVKKVCDEETQVSVKFTYEAELLRGLIHQLKNKEMQIARLKKLTSNMPVRPKKEMDVVDGIHILEKYFQGTLLNLLKCELFNKSANHRRYTEDVKDFAMELYSTSRKAYNLLRNVFQLPHPKCLYKLKSQPKIIAESPPASNQDNIERESPSTSYTIEYLPQ